VSASALDGRLIVTHEERLSRRPRNVTAAVMSTAVRLTERVVAEAGERNGPLRDVVIAAPTVPGPAGEESLRPDGDDRFDRLPLPAGVPVVVENNVNCAAVAEHRVGAARNHDDFVYLQVGVKIGLGIMVNGRLLYGAHGAAGEVMMMPFPWTPEESPKRAVLEEYLGSAALLARCHDAWPAGQGAPPRDTEALFAAATRGSEVARRFVDRHARDVGRLVVGVMSVVDPGLVVLGGGVGQNQLLLPEVRQTVRELAWDTEITTGALGEHATVQGAVHIAIGRALARIA
jgi:predicted NBD/HSP70 family sugar kinase